jgi:hypothetical protein
MQADGAFGHDAAAYLDAGQPAPAEEHDRQSGGAVIKHQLQQRDVVLRRDPQRPNPPGDTHTVAVAHLGDGRTTVNLVANTVGASREHRLRGLPGHTTTLWSWPRDATTIARTGRGGTNDVGEHDAGVIDRFEVERHRCHVGVRQP